MDNRKLCRRAYQIILLVMLIAPNIQGQSFTKFFQSGVFTLIRKDTVVSWSLDTNKLQLKSYIRKIAYDTIPSSGSYDSFNAIAEGNGCNSSNANDSSQLLWDGSQISYSTTPGAGVAWRIMSFTLLSQSPNYGASYSNSSVAWSVGADSTLGVNIRKQGADYWVTFYKYSTSNGMTASKTGGTFLYREQVSSSFFSPTGTNSMKLTVRIRR